MKTLSKATIMLMTLVCAAAPLSAQATSVEVSQETTMQQQYDAQPRADVIVYKFREYNGVQQYRRWNETRNYWVDSSWINMP